MSSFLFASLLSFSFIIGVAVAEFSADDCKSLGFNKANLLCSTCEEFSKHNLNEIRDNCKECCLKDDDYDIAGRKRYAKAILEVCACKFGAYPQIQAFIKSTRPAKFKNLEIKHAWGLDPIIKLLDAENKVEDIVDIHKWDTDSIDEFLATHLSTD